jgi:glyoxylase-like metal-dependent hydrolase (beta-lactamase superfamily II)
MLAISRREDPMGQMISNWREHGDAGSYLHDVLGSRFELSVERQVMPTRTFADELVVHVGETEVRLVGVGPAHTVGDVVVHVPARRVVFTGDVVFHRVHPMVTGVPVSDWISACRRIMTWDVEVVVPGHGPVTDLSGVRHMLDYLEQLRSVARVRFDAGMTWNEAVADIPLDQFPGWVDDERVAITVANLFHDFGGPKVPLTEVLGLAGRRRRGAV